MREVIIGILDWEEMEAQTKFSENGNIYRVESPEELIRCKDCKYFSTDFNGYNHCDLYMDAYSPWAESRYSPSESDYCSQAERKEE